MEKYQIDLVLDVGANRGQFVRALRRFYKGPIISFEPVPSTFTILQQTTLNDNNWFRFNYALGNESGEQCINIYTSDQLNSLLEAKPDSISRFVDGEEIPDKELVQVRRFLSVY